MCPTSTSLSAGLTVEWSENNQKKKAINVPSDVYELGCIQDVEDGLKVRMPLKSVCCTMQFTVRAKTPFYSLCQAAEKIGYPVMIKASEGGGGKGIRKVNCADDFPNLFRQASLATDDNSMPFSTITKCLLLGKLFQGSHSPSNFGSKGAGRSSWLAHFCHAACQACSSPGGADPGRSVRQRHLSVWTRLLCAAAAPEDHRGGSCYHRHI